MQSCDLGGSTYEMLYRPSKNEDVNNNNNNKDESSKKLLFNRQAQTLSQDYEVMNGPDEKI